MSQHREACKFLLMQLHKELYHLIKLAQIKPFEKHHRINNCSGDMTELGIKIACVVQRALQDKCIVPSVELGCCAVY